MDRVVDFSPPSADERLALWTLHLPDDHGLPAALLRRIATQCDLNGGQIRNAALKATLLAIVDASRTEGAAGSTPGTPGRRRRAPEDVTISDEHLIAAIEDEYRKNGAMCPLTTESPDSDRGRAQHFVEGMAAS